MISVMRVGVDGRELAAGVRTGIAWLYARRAVAIITDSEYSRRAVIKRLGVNPAKIRMSLSSPGR